MSLKQLVEAFEDHKKAKEVIESELEKLNTDLEALQQLIIEQFAEDGLTSIKTEKGATLVVRTSVYPRVANKSLVMDWIRKNRATEMLMVSHTSLRSVCTELLEAGKELPAGVEVYLKDSLSLRKSKGENND